MIFAHPIDAIYSLMLVAPVGLLILRLTMPDITWGIIWILTPVISWFIVNYALWLDPPDNGFASFLGLIMGWFILLPFMGFLWLLQALAFHFLPRFSTSRGFLLSSRIIGIVTVIATLFLFFHGTFGKVDQARAINSAAYFLTRDGPVLLTEPSASWNGDYWTIVFPHSNSPEVLIDRNGKFTSFGG